MNRDKNKYIKIFVYNKVFLPSFFMQQNKVQKGEKDRQKEQIFISLAKPNIDLNYFYIFSFPKKLIQLKCE